MSARCVEVRGRGGPEVLHVVPMALPEPRKGEVRVRVEASGVAYGDVMRRRGILAPPWRFVPGYDVAGVVEAVGASVDSRRVGDRVAALLPRTGFGGYASHVCVPAAVVAAVPDSVDSTRAAALVLNYITAYQILHHTLSIGAKSRLLVHGGGGGVGTAALQLARLAGATSWSTASAGKHDVIRSLGATPIDYRSVRFEQVLAEACPEGLDAVIDGIGGPHLRRSWAITRERGTVVSLGISGSIEKGWMALLEAAWVMAALWTDRSRSLSVYLIAQRYGVVDDLASVLQLAGEAKVDPVIGARVPFGDVREAHDLLDRSAVAGKIVLTHP